MITSCSLIEAKWKSLRAYQKSNDPSFLTRANLALEGFQTNRFSIVLDPWKTPDASAFTDELLISGSDDYMDCWIAGTAKDVGVTLVSEDYPLLNHIGKLSLSRGSRQQNVEIAYLVATKEFVITRN